MFGQTGIGGRQTSLDDLVPVHLEDPADPLGAEVVDPGGRVGTRLDALAKTMDHEGPLATESPQRARDVLDTRRVKDSHELTAHAGGVTQGPEQVEDGAKAQLAPHGPGVPHRWVQRASEQKNRHRARRCCVPRARGWLRC